MHLLVLSAFRLDGGSETEPNDAGLNAPFGAQCFPTRGVDAELHGHLQSQCTFWCSVLSDRRRGADAAQRVCLNAPFGAQCFPTLPTALTVGGQTIKVSMHLLVLSAFRREASTQHFCDNRLNAPFGAQCFPTTSRP